MELPVKSMVIGQLLSRAREMPSLICHEVAKRKQTGEIKMDGWRCGYSSLGSVYLSSPYHILCFPFSSSYRDVGDFLSRYLITGNYYLAT